MGGLAGPGSIAQGCVPGLPSPRLQLARQLCVTSCILRRSDQANALYKDGRCCPPEGAYNTHTAVGELQDKVKDLLFFT